MARNVKLESREKYKRLVKIAFGLCIVATEALIYWHFWMHHYNPYMHFPFERRGNWVMILIYGILVLIFTYSLGGFRIGVQRIGSLIYSQILALIFVNLVTYLIIAITNHALMPPLPLWRSFLLSIPAVILVTNLYSRMYKKIFPRRNLLLVFGDHEDYNLFSKMQSRNDRYEIESTIYYKEFLRIMDAEILKYDGIIVGDIPSKERNDIIKKCYDENVRTYTVPKISDILMRSSEDFALFDSPLLLSRNLGILPDQEFWKRLLDILCAAVLLVLTSPLFLFETVAIKCTDGGPVFYRQRRLTKDHREFTILKFRTMVMDADKMGEPHAATQDDPRILPVGKFLRRTRMDELPQLLNVLKGDMSMVGPRPEWVETQKQIEKELPEYSYRLKVKAGLTGYAQIYGKYSTQPYDKLKLDLMYIRNYSFLLDVKLILMTPMVLFMKDSSAGVEENQEELKMEFENKVMQDEEERKEEQQ